MISFKPDKITEALLNIVLGLIYLYILSIPFQTPIFKLMGLTVSLTEIVFLFLSLLALTYIFLSKQRFWFNKVDLFVLGWLFSNILSGWHAGFDSIVIAEIIKTVYLVIIYIILKLTIPLHTEIMIPQFFIISGFLAASIGMIGFGLEYTGIDTPLAIKRAFPYGIKVVIQAKGFTESPNMLASIIMIGCFFHFERLINNSFKSNIKDQFILFILLLGFALTFSKTVVCLLLGIILIVFFNYKSIISKTWHLIAKSTIIILPIIYVLLTHFIFTQKNQDLELLKGDYIAGSALINLSNYTIYPSQYWSYKEIAIKAVKQSFPWGLGPGKFNEFAHELKKSDEFPTHVIYPDPHSTYLGIFAENGLFGLLILLGLIFFIVKYSRLINVFNVQSVDKHIITCLPSIFIVIGIEAISTDIMNFKQYWVLLIFLVYMFQTHKSIFQ